MSERGMLAWVYGMSAFLISCSLMICKWLWDFMLAMCVLGWKVLKVIYLAFKTWKEARKWK